MNIGDTIYMLNPYTENEITYRTSMDYRVCDQFLVQLQVEREHLGMLVLSDGSIYDGSPYRRTRREGVEMVRKIIRMKKEMYLD